MNDLPVSKVYFKRAASNYDSVRRRDKMTAIDDLAIVDFLEGLEKEFKLLDVPCGTGRCIPLILNRNLLYTGVDVSEDMLKISRDKTSSAPNFKLIQADARALPFSDGEFDHLISFKFVKWLPNDEVVYEVLKEFRRVVKGKLLINVKVKPQNIRFDYREIRDRLRKFLDQIRIGTTARCIDQHIFEELCSRAGFKILRCQANGASNGFVFNYTLECD